MESSNAVCAQGFLGPSLAKVPNSAFLRPELRGGQPRGWGGQVAAIHWGLRKTCPT